MKHTPVSSHECAEKLWNGCGMNNPRKQVLISNNILFYTQHNITYVMIVYWKGPFCLAQHPPSLPVP